jgi:hypothetical protein
MLGYTKDDLDTMINSIHDVKLFYLRSPSDLIDKKPITDGLLKSIDFLQGLCAEGYFD